ncbi:MAG: glycosyltransferase [Chromatiales bacterium]|nr:glycosyltransferase [Chromatiales bacterium]
MSRPDIALFAATSGHSGVDRVFTNLASQFLDQGLRVDQLVVRDHGPNMPLDHQGFRRIELGPSSVYPSLPAVVRYLRRERPRAMLSDKDRVNRVAVIARAMAGGSTRLAVRIGSTISHNLARRSPLQRFGQRISSRYLATRADTIVVPSIGAADDLARFAGIPRNFIQVAPNPFDFESMRQRAAADPGHPWFEDGRGPVILGAGELSARKDFATLVRAFHRLPDDLHARLIILGRGRKREALEALTRELNSEDKVALPGFTDNPFPYLRRADLFVLSSTNEGFGNVLVEAMALGTPVVSTDCPSGPREVLQGGRFGTLVPVGDDAAMAAAMAHTLREPPLPEHLAEAVRPYDIVTSALRYREILGL